MPEMLVHTNVARGDFQRLVEAVREAEGSAVAWHGIVYSRLGLYGLFAGGNPALAPQRTYLLPPSPTSQPYLLREQRGEADPASRDGRETLAGMLRETVAFHEARLYAAIAFDKGQAGAAGVLRLWRVPGVTEADMAGAIAMALVEQCQPYVDGAPIDPYRLARRIEQIVGEGHGDRNLYDASTRLASQMDPAAEGFAATYGNALRSVGQVGSAAIPPGGVAREAAAPR